MGRTAKSKEFVLDMSPVDAIMERARENAKKRDLEFKKLLAQALLSTYPDPENYVINEKGLIDFVGTQQKFADAD